MTLATRLMKTGMGLVLLLVGLGFTVALFIPFQRSMETRSWTETPATMTECSIIPPSANGFDPAWRVKLRYHYRFNSSDYQGTRWRRVHFYEKADEFVSRKTPDREIAEELASKYPVGKMVSCYVNPITPEEAVLEHQTRAAIYTLWWPMIFAIGGAGMIWSAWRGLSRRRPT